MIQIFEQGDIIYLDFDPQAGHEQRGRRPALVVSNAVFNRTSSLTMVCPITNTNRNHPLHIPLDDHTKTTGVVMCDQVRTLDLAVRNATYVEKATPETIGEAIDIIIGIVEA